MVPLKQKYARANNSPCMIKTILKAIMKQTSPRNNFLKHKCEAEKRAYNAKKSLEFP